MTDKGQLLARGDESVLQDRVRVERLYLWGYFVLGGALLGMVSGLLSIPLMRTGLSTDFCVLSTLLFPGPLILLLFVLKKRATFPTGVFNAYEKGFDSPRRFRIMRRAFSGTRRKREDLENERNSLLGRSPALAHGGAERRSRSRSRGGQGGAADAADDDNFVAYEGVNSLAYGFAGHWCELTLHGGATLTLVDDYGFEAYRVVCETIQRRLGITEGPDFDVVRQVHEADRYRRDGRIAKEEFAGILRREREVNGRFS